MIRAGKVSAKNCEKWDIVHDPAWLVSWFQDDAGSAMVALPCWGWFDDCDDVLAILKGIKSRVANKSSMLPLFKPDVSKKRGKEYVALSLEIEGEEYKRILIQNEIKEDGTVDPRVYYDYESEEKDNPKAGFMYKAADDSFFKILLSSERDSATVYAKREKLRKYLFDDLKPKGEVAAKKSEEIFLDQIQYVSQFDETIFGLCTGCWTSTCCRRATEYMMGNTNIANCTDTLIAKSAPYMAILGNIITASFSDNTTKYTKETYNAATLNYNSKNSKDAVDYMMERLRNNKPVLIGVHYTNGGTPPNNNNRATRHFMVVVGMTVSGESIAFRFYDPGRSLARQNDATSISNLLKYNADKGYVQGTYNSETYTLTEIVKTQ